MKRCCLANLKLAIAPFVAELVCCGRPGTGALVTQCEHGSDPERSQARGAEDEQSEMDTRQNGGWEPAY